MEYNDLQFTLILRTENVKSATWFFECITLKIPMIICVVQTIQILCNSHFAQISTFFSQNLCDFHEIAQISIKTTQIYSESHTKYLCTDLSHSICVTSLADTNICANN
jgi:hypothetical protein